jgi:hypothetical protein
MSFPDLMTTEEDDVCLLLGTVWVMIRAATPGCLRCHDCASELIILGRTRSKIEII